MLGFGFVLYFVCCLEVGFRVFIGKVLLFEVVEEEFRKEAGLGVGEMLWFIDV